MKIEALSSNFLNLVKFESKRQITVDIAIAFELLYVRAYSRQFNFILDDYFHECICVSSCCNSALIFDACSAQRLAGRSSVWSDAVSDGSCRVTFW